MTTRALRAIVCAAATLLAASVSSQAQELVALHGSPCAERIDLPLANPAAQAEACTAALAGLPSSPSEEAAAHMVRARAYETLKDTTKAHLDYRAAVEQYDKAILQSDPNAVLYYRRGVAHHALGEADLAIKDYDQSIKLDSTIPLAFANRGTLLNSHLGNAYSALADFDKAVALAPSNPVILILRGQVQVRLGNYAAARADLYRAASLAPDLGRVEAEGNAVASEYGQKQQVSAEGGKAPAMMLDGISALFSRAVLEAGIGENDMAIADLDQVLKARPLDAYAFFNRGYARFARGDYEAAIADYSAALQIDPSIAMAYNNRCLARAIVGRDVPNALTDCQEAARKLPGLGVVRETHGFVYLKLGDFSSALAEYDAALDINPHSAVALYGRGIARLHLGNGSGHGDKMAALAIDRSIDNNFAAFEIR